MFSMVSLCWVFLCSLAILQAAGLVSNSNKHRHQASHNDLLLYQRLKRAHLAQDCSAPYDYRCYDGTCIQSNRTCDGKPDCPDASDETHHLCRNIKCPGHQFRCAYGACVGEHAACNGIKDCSDSSDELPERCGNRSSVDGIHFRCQNGQLIDLYMRCDGLINCGDGSDETLRACAHSDCPPHQFQCAYGACVSEGSECNGIADCADGSDESDLLCDRKPPTTPSTTTVETLPVCVIPNHPEHGRFHVNGLKRIVPGMREDVVYFNVTCDPGYMLVGSGVIFCYYGDWSVDQLPTCVPACKVEPSSSVVYRCLITEFTGSEGTRDCKDMEAEGTIIQPECRQPNFYSPTELSYMYCINGEWSYTPTCLPECGLLTPKGVPLIVGGSEAKRGEIPWHAAIYWKDGPSHRQICGGSLVSVSVILSAAHCFWDEQYKQLPASRYAAAVGKLYRQWTSSRDDLYTQKSDVRHVYLSQYFYGAELNYQHDLAVVIVVTPFVYRTYVRPICLDFDDVFSDRQLQEGNFGKVAGFGLTTARIGSESDILKVLDMPFVPYQDCIRLTSPAFIEFLSGEKICAGYGNGTALCRGDSGGGLAFPSQVHGKTRYYIRGIVSTSPPSLDGKQCNLYTLTSFEPVLKHEKLIKRHWTL